LSAQISKKLSSKENKKNIKSWLKKINKKKINIKKIKIINEIYRKNKDFNICSVDCIIKINNGKEIKRVIQIEGKSVVIIPIIKLANEKYLRTILIRQIRYPVGDETLEFPSGSQKTSDPKNDAIKEIYEELGLKIKKNKLKILNRKRIFMIPSNTFGPVQFYYFKIYLKNNEIQNFNNKKTGVTKHGEYTKTKVFKFKDILDSNTSSVLVGLFLLKKIFIPKKNEILF
jgi:hypothetical protein